MRDTELCKLAFKYGSDKCPQLRKHTYTEYYYDLFKNKKKTVRKMLEIGIGQGFSLYMWRDFFPNAKIYGADNQANRLIIQSRIQSFLCDQSKEVDLKKLIKKTGPDIDLVIDDASHKPEDQVLTCLTLMPLLNKGVTYIIEDVADPTIVDKLGEYDVEVPPIRQPRKRYDNRLVIVKHKKRSKDKQTNPKRFFIEGIKSPALPAGRPTLLEGTKLKGRPAEIPNCSRDDLPQFFVDMGFKVGAEVGVDRGEFSEKFAQARFKFYAIDPWLSYNDYGGSKNPSETDFFNRSYEHAKRVLSPYSNCTIIRKTSMEAVRDFEDKSLDFVYIDGNHQFRYIADDLCEWSKKVKKGGVISGHDYIYTNPRTQAGICHVIYVVNAYTQAYKIYNWYLLGRYKRLEGEKRDRFRSWMWINPVRNPT